MIKCKYCGHYISDTKIIDEDGTRVENYICEHCGESCCE